MADGLIAPVRMGMVRPSIMLSKAFNVDHDNVDSLEVVPSLFHSNQSKSLQILENHLCMEDDLSTMIRKYESGYGREEKRGRKKKSKEAREEKNEGGRGEGKESSAESDGPSDSDSDDGRVFRTFCE